MRAGRRLHAAGKKTGEIPVSRYERSAMCEMGPKIKEREAELARVEPKLRRPRPERPDGGATRSPAAPRHKVK
jgi:hypothetical protein